MLESKPLGVGKIYAASLVGSLVTIIVLGIVVLYQSRVESDRKKLNPKGGGNTSSPIKVRGGAMTARSLVTGGWSSGGDGKTTFCSNTPDVSVVQIGDQDPMTGQIPGWTIQILGHSSKTDDSQHGLLLTSQKGDCKGKAMDKKVSVVLSLVDLDQSGKVSFYTPGTATADDTTDAQRFRDASAVCTGPNGFEEHVDQQGNKTYKAATGDEDVCEHAGAVTFTPIQGSPVSFRCTNGECTIQIGKPQ